MQTLDWTRVLAAFAVQLPIMLACIVAIVVILSNKALPPRAIKWAVAGFTLTLVLCFVMPALQALLMSNALGGDVARIRVVFAGVSLVNAVLHAVAYVFLLVAIVARGRERSSSAELE